MPDASPTRSRRSNASEINERRPSGFVAVSDISSLRQQIREDVQKEMQRGAKEIHQVLCQGLADLIRKLHGKAVDLDPPPRSRINEDNIRGFEAAIKQTVALPGYYPCYQSHPFPSISARSNTNIVGHRNPKSPCSLAM